MEQASGSGENSLGANALLAAYQLLIETTVEPGDDEVLLQRTLAVLAAIPWPVPHRFFSAFLTPGDPSPLRLAAATVGTGATLPPCPAPGSCLCGRALTHPGRLLCIHGTGQSGHAPCDPAGTGTHLILPISARSRILGVLHVLVDPGRPAGEPGLSFLAQVATLLGATLHRRRGEREHDRLEMQFLQAQKMEAMGRLAGGVAHDFNNILTTITSYADLGLLKLPQNNPLRRNFDEIISASERATLLTQQLLAFSRHRAHAPRVIDLGAVVGEMGKTLRRMFGSIFELSLAIETGPMHILADPALVEQLIINLVVNARESMPQGGAMALSIAPTVLGDENRPDLPANAQGSHVVLTLTVHGGGHDPKTLLALCLPGEQNAALSIGAALGPAAVHDIIRECGGFARAEAAPDGGNALQLFFPAASVVAAPVAGNAGGGRLPVGSETVLLVEDDDSVRVVMAVILRDLGYQLLEAREGREALAVAAAYQGRIDALLTDVVLRGFGGGELWRRLAATRPGLRVLYVSGVTDDTTDLPDTLSLPKPFSPGALALRLRQVLDAPSPA